MNKDKKITISVDCMGGDNSIDDILGGVNSFCSENNNDTLLLHGDKKAIAAALEKYPEIKHMCKINLPNSANIPIPFSQTFSPQAAFQKIIETVKHHTFVIPATFPRIACL